MKRALIGLLFVACSAKSNDLPAESWGATDYAKVGLAVDRPWAGPDYTEAATILQRESDGHRDRLPRYNGPKSGGVFARMIADLPDDPAKPIADRLGAHVDHIGALNTISKLYMQNALATPPREWIEITGAQLREAATTFTLIEPFLASFPADDPSRETRMNGLAKMKQGYSQMLVGCFMVADNLRVPMADRIAIVKHATAVLPVLFPAAPADMQQSIRDTIAKEAAGFKDGELKDAVIAAQHALPAN